MDIANQTFPTKHDLRLQRFWGFLSNDLVKNFYREIWLPIDHPDPFQKGIRATLEGLNAEDPNYIFAGRSNAAIQSWAASTLSTVEQALLPLWARAVYVGDGSDRLSETVWSALISKLANRPDEFHLGSTYEAICKVQKSTLAQRADLQPKLDDLTTALDFEPRKDVSGDSVDLPHPAITKISLIASYNNFALSWDRHCRQLDTPQLSALYDVGATIAIQQNMSTQGIPFPGSWQFELGPFLDRRMADS